MKLRISVVAGFLVVASACLVVYAQKDRSCTEKESKAFFERIQQVKGKVTILNHPDLGKTPGTGMYLVFQREGCDDCLIGVNTDWEGTYKVSLGVGRYKVMSLDPRCDYGGGGCACYNMLDSKQAEFIDVKRGSSNIQFDISISLAK